MTDGGIHTIEDEVDELHQDLGKARLRVHDIERAMLDGRMVNEPEHDQALRRAKQRVADLERDIERLT